MFEHLFNTTWFSQKIIFDLLRLFELFNGAVVLRVQENPFEGGMAHSVAAALQTKGLIDQGAILSQITSLDMIAAFFYLVALALAVGSVAVFGNYRQGAYLLIGPVLYTFMVTVTTQSDGIKTKLGEHEVPNSVGRVNEFLKHIKAIDNSGPANISLFYATFDGIVTEVYHSLIEFLHNSANIEHQKLIGRERALSFVLSGMPDEYAQISRLISRHHQVCNEPMKEFYRGGKDIAGNTIYSGRDQGDAQKSIEQAKKDISKVTITLDGKDTSLKRLLKATVDNSIKVEETYTVNCEVAWKWIGSILKGIAELQMSDDAIYGTQEEESPGEGDRAKESEDVKKWLREAAGTDEKEVLAAIMYKNALETTTHGALEGHIYSRTQYNHKDMRASYKDMITAEARASYLSLRMFAGTIPYIQGLLLYLLSIGFPFFAMLLVIPGRAMSFLGWCSLWAWVKSWDVGFAIVHVARDLLWDVFKDKVDMFDSGLKWEEPGSVYAFIAKNDPFANQNTYHELVSFLTISVPFLTAHLFLGANSMFSMFRLSIDQTAGRYRTFQASVGVRDATTQKSIQRDDMRELFSYHAAQAMNSLPAMEFDAKGNPLRHGAGGGSGVGPAGGYMGNSAYRQTITGQPIARERIDNSIASTDFNAFNAAYGKQNSDNKLLGLSYRTMHNAVPLMDANFVNKMESSFQELRQMESQVNANTSFFDRDYHIEGVNLSKLFEETPVGNGSKLLLDTPVPADVMNKYREKTGEDSRSWIKNLAEGEQVTWRQFIERDMAELNSKQEGEKYRLSVPHIARMLPPMDMRVSDAAIQVLPAHNSLRQRHEAAGNDESLKANWREYLIAANHEVKSSAHTIGMLEGRPADNQINGTGAALSHNFMSAVSMDQHGRAGIVGNSNDSIYYTATGQFVLGLMNLDNEISKYGVGSDPDGADGASPRAGESKGPSGDGDGAAGD